MSDPTGPDGFVADLEPEVDHAEIQRAMFELRSQQSIIGGTVAGLAASAVGAAAWAAITIVSGVQIGLIAIGIGFLVGSAVRAVGKGVDPIFGYIGAALALLGCMVGNLGAMIGVAAENQGIPFLDLASQLTFNDLTRILVASFSPMDLLFYGIAIYEGYRLSFRQLTEGDADTLLADQ